MKRNTYFKIFGLFLTAIVFLIACNKKDDQVTLAPILGTSQVTNLSAYTASVTGVLLAGTSSFTERGVCWGTATAPTTATNKIVDTLQVDKFKAAFTVALTGVLRQTTYYARAYGITGGTTMYGQEFTFTTPASLPTVATAVFSQSLESITKDQGVVEVMGYNVTDNGGTNPNITVTDQGIVLSATNALPTTSDDKRAGVGSSNTVKVNNLNGNTTYHARAYATNAIGTAYGAAFTFTTSNGYPIVTTSAVPQFITTTSESVGGTVTSDGGTGAITASGVCYGTSQNPDITGSKLTNASVTVGSPFVNNLTGLQTNTTYYIRAFATNSVGTNYGPQVQVSVVGPYTLWIPGGYEAASGYTTDWSQATSPTLVSVAADPVNAQGYVYFATAGPNFKLSSAPDWNHTNYGEGATAFNLDPTGGNIVDVTAAGYYFMSFDIIHKKLTATPTTWGIIGDATVGGWSTQTDMTYDPVAKTFSITAPLVSSSGAKTFKFRGTSDWSINYGGSNGMLTAGGANIGVPSDGTYLITLDLSHPNAYTYTMVKQ